MTNRVSNYIGMVRDKVEKLGEPLNGGTWEEAESNLDLTFSEHAAYQNAQAQAHAGGILNTEEAQIVYLALGEVGSTKNGGWAASVDYPVKVAITKLVGELMGV
jgi:hypothetical protein